MTNLLFFTHVRCWLPRQMMLVRNNDVLFIVLAWGGGGVGGGYFRSLLIANRQDVLRYRCVL